MRWRRAVSSARLALYLTVMRQQPMALHARRSLIPWAPMRFATAFRLAAGVTTSFPTGPSAPHCPASRRPKGASAACSHPPASSAAWLPRPPSHRTSLSICNVADAVLAAQIGDRDAGLVLLQNPDDLLFRKAAALHALVLVVGPSELQTGLSPWGKVIRNILIFWLNLVPQKGLRPEQAR